MHHVAQDVNIERENAQEYVVLESPKKKDPAFVIHAKQVSICNLGFRSDLVELLRLAWIATRIAILSIERFKRNFIKLSLLKKGAEAFRKSVQKM